MSRAKMVVILVAVAVLAGTTAALAVVAGPRQAVGANTGPVSQFTTHLIATHYLRGQAYETHHYFKSLRDGVLQGIVFRGTDGGAPLIEIEWAISGDVFDALPEWQKEFWHPLAPAVDAGRVSVPGVTAEDERSTLATVRGLYAQTINVAGLDGALPVGLEGVAMVTHLTRDEMLRAMGSGATR